MTDPFTDTYDTLAITTLTDGIVHLCLDRQPELNAINETLLDELNTVLDILERHESARLLLISGSGSRAFSIGADIRHRLDELSAETARRLSCHGQRTFAKLARFPGPVLASIDGYCLGGGMELAACADLRIASPDATFSQPEQELGLIPGWGGTQRLPRIIGLSRAKHVIFTAEEFDAETMHEYGFITELSATPFETTRDRAEGLAEYSSIAQRYAKRAIQTGLDTHGAGFAFESSSFGYLVDQRRGEDNADDTDEGGTPSSN
ncbi:MAG: enoyl-CoA hydratase/isomerase family protein [Halobacteriales archaeon]|nr:enoyl-CoA hydratase/isomerase family protein [Halobacteriales archaeon]